MSVIKKILRNDNVSLLILLSISSVLSYLFQLAMGRFLIVDDYGLLNTWISLVAIVTAPGSVLIAISTRYIAEVDERNQVEIREIATTIVQLTGVFILLLLIIMIPSAQLVAKVMRVNKEIIYIAIITSCCLMISVVMNGIAQGLQYFIIYGFQEIILNISKLLLCGLLAYLGANIEIILLMYTLSYVIQIIYGVFKLRKHFSVKAFFEGINFNRIREWIPYMIGASIARVAMLAYQNIDTLIMKSKYSEYDVGLYTAANVIARIGLYIPTMLVIPLFPKVVQARRDGKTTLKMMIKYLSLAVGISGLYSIFIFIFGEKIMRIIYGVNYIGSVQYIMRLCSYTMGLTILLIIMNYVLAIGETKIFSIYSIIGLILMFFLSKIEDFKMENTIIMFDVVIIILNILLISNIVIKDKKK